MGSVKASLKPWKKDCCCELTQSSVPMSSWRRQMARARSLSDSQVVVRGKLGRMKKAMSAKKTVMVPSMINSQRQASMCRRPSMPLVMPAAMRPEKAPEIRDPL